MIRFAQISFAFSIALTFALAGCSDGSGVDLASVTGMVTDKSGPVAGATVEFHPKQGRPSYATTGPDGHYELRYSAEEDGAVVGPHSIRVTTGEAASAPANDNEEVLEVASKTVALPGEMEVVAGENSIDIDLSAATPIAGGSSRSGREVLERPTR